MLRWCSLDFSPWGKWYPGEEVLILWLNPLAWPVPRILLLLIRRGRDDRPAERPRSPPRGERKREREPSPRSALLHVFEWSIVGAPSSNSLLIPCQAAARGRLKEVSRGRQAGQWEAQGT